MAVKRVAKTVARKIVKKKTVKVNSNPNKTPAKGERNPTQTKLDREERMDPMYDKYGYPSKQTIKIKSSIPKRRGK
jgi:hypothetical protein